MSSPGMNFNDLGELHKCANDLLLSPQIQQALIDHHQQEMSSVREICEASLKILDLCGETRDSLLLVKENFQELQQILRRAKIEGPDFEAQISAHTMQRKKLKKDHLAKCMRGIKGMKSKYFTSDLSLIDHSLIVVVHVLREVRGATISILESLLSLVTLPTVINDAQRSSLASKFMRINCQRMLERSNSMQVRMANKRLEEVQSAIEDLEVELECIFRRLMRTRVLLLNLLTN